MKIRYILGSAGSGKFTACVNDILKKQRLFPNKTNILIVPEQFSAYAEKVLVNNTAENVIVNTQVLSFKRLSYQIFSDIGSSKKVVLEDCGKSMIIRKILRNLQDELLYFTENSYTNLGLIEKILTIIQDFFKYNVTLDKLQEFLETHQHISKNENLIDKIHDLKLIYQEYLNYIEKDYITSDEILDILAGCISKSKFIENSEIWIYGFTGFTSQELNVIENMSKKVEKINIALLSNSENTDVSDVDIFDPFYEVKVTIKKIEKIRINNNLEKEVLYLDKENSLNRHFNNPELLYLSQNYLSYDSNFYLKSVQNIEIFSCNNKYTEIENIAKKIIDLVRDHGYQFNDIGVVLSDTSYSKTINSIFNKYEIPYFLDFKKSIKDHLLVNLICSALDIIIYNWSYVSVFQYLKTGFILGYGDESFTIKKEDINSLENYVIAYGINGYKWNLDWKYGFDNLYFDKEQINNTKEKVLKSIKCLDFKKDNKYSVKEISIKIINFLKGLDISKKLEIIAEKDKTFNINGNSSKYEEHYQVWNSVMLILEKLVEILGEDEVTIEEYSKILKAGLEKNTIAIYPLTQDQVIIGDFKRTRFPKIKAMFVLTVNEGVIPPFIEDKEVISDVEKVILLDGGIEISPESTKLLCQENLYIYSKLTKPTEKLFLSYLSSDLDGKSKRASFVIERIRQIFKNLKVKVLNQNTNILDEIYTPRSTFEKIFELSSIIPFDNKNEESIAIKNILSWFFKDKVYKLKLESVESGLKMLPPQASLSKNIISKIYKNNEIFFSVSKLEKFNSCQFRYFLEYNLNLKEREEYKLNNSDYGNFYHSILEQFSKLVFNNNNKVDYEKIDKYIENFAKQYVSSINTDIFKNSQRYKNFLKNLKRVCKHSAYAIIKQVENGSFKPDGFEVKINADNSTSIQLNNNYKIMLNGKIDRVDLLKDKDKLYVKILDYKSYDNKLDFTKLYYGLQLQLITYLDAFIKSNGARFLEEEIFLEPAGIFYFKIHEPILDLKEIKGEAHKLVNKIESSFDVKGLYADEEVVKRGINKDFNNKNSKVGRGVSRSSNILNKGQFSELRNFSYNLIKETGEEITSGSIKINPYKHKNRNACEYCSYKNICNIEFLENFKNSDEYGYKFLKEKELIDICGLNKQKNKEGY